MKFLPQKWIENCLTSKKLFREYLEHSAKGPILQDWFRKALWSEQSVDCRDDDMFEMKWVFCCIRHIVHKMESARCCWEIGWAVWDQDLCVYSPRARYFKFNSYHPCHIIIWKLFMYHYFLMWQNHSLTVWTTVFDFSFTMAAVLNNKILKLS